MRAFLTSLFAFGTLAQYAPDSTWNVEKDVPRAASIGVSGDEVFVATEGSTPVYVFDKSGNLKKTFGKGDVKKAHGIRIQRAATADEEDTVWVTDMQAGKIVQFSLDGKKITSFGSHGSSTGQFIAPADIAFHGDVAFISDGDSGNDNRVTAWKLSGASGMQWQTKSEFDSPHSIEYHEQMKKLIIANRFAKNIHVLDPVTGNDEGVLRCDALGLGESKPYSVRVIGTTLLVVSNDGKKGHQFLHIVEFSSGMECGKMIQSIPIDAKHCATPHLLGIDRDTEDLYVACLAGGGVKRFTKKRLQVVV